jgi:hypothetical protein
MLTADSTLPRSASQLKVSENKVTGKNLFAEKNLFNDLPWIRIRINLQRRIRIRIRLKGWIRIRIRIKSIRIRNTGDEV